MVQTRSTRTPGPVSKKKTSSANSKKRKSLVVEEEEAVIEMQIEETSSQDQRLENVDIAFEEPEPEPEPEPIRVIVAGGETVEAGGIADEEQELDMDELVSDVLRYYEDREDDEDVDDGTNEADTEHIEVLGYHEDVNEDYGMNEAEFDDTEGPFTEKKIVQFNDKAQPIGEEAVPFISYLGSIMRKHCPITYEKWRDVPGQLRETLWKLVTDKYVVAVAYKLKIIERIHNYWRHHKSVLRLTHYDKYNTDEERKRNCPKGVRQDHWNIFVDHQSSPAAQARRRAGKHARKAMKTPHYTGRTGAARTEEALKKGNPLATVTRTDLYLAVHSPKDDSCATPELTEKVRKIKAIAQENPSSINLDTDHDPVAQVCGPERSGRAIRGLGMGVSKPSLRYSAPVLDLLQRERRLRVQAEEQIAGLREQQVGSQRPARRADKDRLGRSPPVTVEQRQIATLREQVASQQPAPRVDQPEEVESRHLSAEEEIDILRKQVVSQKEQIEQLQQERAQITDLKKLIISQGLMIADMRELIGRLCS